MVFRFGEGDVHWLDLENPSADEVHAAAKELELGGRIIDELLSPSPLPIVVREGSCILAVLHFPSAEVIDGKPAEQEVDFVVGSNFVLTVRYDVVAPIHQLRKLLESRTITEGPLKVEGGALVELIFNHLFEHIRAEVTQIGRRFELVERDMFKDRPQKVVRPISLLSRELLHLEASLARQANTLSLFLDEVMHRETWGKTFAIRATRIHAQQSQTVRVVSALRAISVELRETNMALLTVSQNKSIMVLTFISFIILCLQLIASVLYAMD